MNPRFAQWPGTNDQKWFQRKGIGDMPQQYWQEFLDEYQAMWDFWQKEFRMFDPDPQLIWGDAGAPGYRNDFNQPQPSVGLRIHEGEPRSMILVCPGGGFLWKACYEGTVVAERFYNEGFNVAVLDYRVNPYSSADAMADAVRAMRFLRYNAERYNTLPDRIGMMGFSAGGFLTSHCATMFDAGNPKDSDPVERCTNRPDAAVLGYGAGGSVFNSKGILGYSREKQAELAKTSAESNIRLDSPPFFLWQCAGQDDPRSGMNFADILTAYGIPFELHIFPYGFHGTALSEDNHPDEKANDPHVAHWVLLCCEWLCMYKF